MISNYDAINKRVLSTSAVQITDDRIDARRVYSIELLDFAAAEKKNYFSALFSRSRISSGLRSLAATVPRLHLFNFFFFFFFKSTPDNVNRKRRAVD